VNCPGKLRSGVSADLVDASDFLPTLTELAGGSVPESWGADGISFAPAIAGRQGPKRDYAFFWYDPRPGWNKTKFSRHIFALDHRYKCFSDGRLFAISGLGMKETLVIAESAETQAARKKLLSAIAKEMVGGEPPEVDSYGQPVGSD
jgi:arylsulfatase A-like enzyme